MSGFKQLGIAAAANLGAIASGMTLGFSAVALPAMQDVTEEQASWIAAITSIGMPFGCLLIGPMVDGLGRKRTLMFVNIPTIIGWIFIATAYQPWFLNQLYAGRFLTGFSCVLSCQPAVVYVSEVTDKKLRGVLATWTVIGVSMGILIVYILGAVLQENWRLTAWISAFFPTVALLVVWCLLPESPVWLSTRGKHQEAELSMRKIRNVGRAEVLSDPLKRELEAMIESSSRNAAFARCTDTLQYFKRPEAYKPFVIMNTFQFFQQFAGIFVVIFYGVSIVRETGSHFDSYLATVLIGVARLLGAVIISFASKYFGRRLLAMSSGMGMTLTFGALVVFMKLTEKGSMSWFPVMALFLYIFTCTMGFLTLPFSMLGEVFPSRIRAWGSGATSFMGCLFAFVVAKVYPDMKTAWGLDNVFAFYAVMSLIGTGFVYLFLPETQGKTLQEVEKYFRGET